MKILFVAPRSITRHANNSEFFRFDYGFWNFYLPLMNLGHVMCFFDTSIFNNNQFNATFERFKPDLIFCVMTGNSGISPSEPWEQIRAITSAGTCKTFNWYCDDTWRFSSFSKQTCDHFHFCSTTEIDHVKKYEDIGYSNIRYANWHSNPEVYSSVICDKNNLLSFVGSLNDDRIRNISLLNEKNFKVNVARNCSIEDMIHLYSSSLVGLNFTKSASDGKRQMKARIFEVPATRSMLLTEHVDGIENLFKVGTEIMTFEDETDLLEKVDWIDKNRSEAYKIGIEGHKRYLADHTSQIRLKTLLDSLV